MVDKHTNTCSVFAACSEKVNQSERIQILPQVPTPVPRLLWGCSALPDHVEPGVQADAHLVGRRLLERCSVAERAQHRCLQPCFNMLVASCLVGMAQLSEVTLAVVSFTITLNPDKFK